MLLVMRMKTRSTTVASTSPQTNKKTSEHAMAHQPALKLGNPMPMRCLQARMAQARSNQWQQVATALDAVLGACQQAH